MRHSRVILSRTTLSRLVLPAAVLLVLSTACASEETATPTARA
ncbi:hypothetical protein ACGFIV_27905 [Sphaerisporangium sp. NPDC049003]